MQAGDQEVRLQPELSQRGDGGVLRVRIAGRCHAAQDPQRLFVWLVAKDALCGSHPHGRIEI